MVNTKIQEVWDETKKKDPWYFCRIPECCETCEDKPCKEWIAKDKLGEEIHKRISWLKEQVKVYEEKEVDDNAKHQFYARINELKELEKTLVSSKKQVQIEDITCYDCRRYPDCKKANGISNHEICNNFCKRCKTPSDCLIVEVFNKQMDKKLFKKAMEKYSEERGIAMYMLRNYLTDGRLIGIIKIYDELKREVSEEEQTHNSSQY